MKRFAGYIYIIAATLFWGISATGAQFLFKQQVDMTLLVQMRTMWSAIVLYVCVRAFRKNLLVINVKDLYRFALLGIVGVAGANFTYYYTIRETNVATAILLQYMAPLLVLTFAAISKEEELTPTKIVASIISLAGCFFAVAGGDFSLVQISRIGLLSGAASAFCWGFANISMRHLLRDYQVWTTLVYAFAFASLFWFFFNPPWELVTQGPSAYTWLLYFGFAMVSVLIPHSLYFLGLRHLTASRAIITATFEPVVAIASAFLFLGEELTLLQIGGAVMVMLAIAALQLRQEPDGIEPAREGRPARTE